MRTVAGAFAFGTGFYDTAGAQHLITTWAAGGEHLQRTMLKVTLRICQAFRLRDSFQIRSGRE